jgi:hypothetical protein
MLSENARKLEKAVLATLPSDHIPTEAEVLAGLISLRVVFPITDEEFKATLHGLHSKLTITLDPGISITDDYKPWLSTRKAEIDPFYWERYRQFLAAELRWPPLVVNVLDRVTDDILDLFGDPNNDDQPARKGLIVGDVQSGKTATYTALSCKAADAGYKLIILLTGTIENLRRQTQERLDEGFVGRDSFEMFRAGKIYSNFIGVGLINREHFATVFTSRSRDFSVQTARQLGFSLESSKEPILLVCKKNAKILENLRTWLQTNNADSHGRIKLPLVLIDDEADSASINTSASLDEATRTNKEIRKLLKLFKRSVYVGVTATPFANVFINPDSDDKMIGDDLFPRDFIYSLEAPNNYLGPRAIFEEGRGAFLEHFSDAESYIPLIHKVDFVPNEIPPSLIDALRSFLLTTTIRDLRGEGPSHRSMLVNVSRFTAVQDRVANLLDAELRTIQREVRLYASLPKGTAMLRSAQIRSLHDFWARDFDTSELVWEVVQGALNSAIQPIVVKTVNQKSGPGAIDYKMNRESGLRVIAVGGNSLSRGLTLEGLSTSYFHRNSQMYDTLLQMGRWFGYRIGYEDLCRLWLTEDAAGWYEHITLATTELRAEFERMNRLGLTPRDFGLKVRSHPDSLIVTARNKMRQARDFVHFISLSENGLETTRIGLKAETNLSNLRATERLIAAVQVSAHREESVKEDWPFWRGVRKDIVVSFLREFHSHALNFNFNVDAIAEFLAETDEPELSEWDVTIVNPGDREREHYSLEGIDVRLVKRKLLVDRKAGFLLVSGTKKRVGSPGDESQGLTAGQIQKVKEHYAEKTIIGKYYRAVREKPLLLLYLIKGHELGEDKQEIPFRPSEPPIVAMALSFPRFDDRAVANRAAYKVNVIEYRNLVDGDLDDDVASEEDDEIA